MHACDRGPHPPRTREAAREEHASEPAARPVWTHPLSVHVADELRALVQPRHRLIGARATEQQRRTEKAHSGAHHWVKKAAHAGYGRHSALNLSTVAPDTPFLTKGCKGESSSCRSFRRMGSTTKVTGGRQLLSPPAVVLDSCCCAALRPACDLPCDLRCIDDRHLSGDDRQKVAALRRPARSAAPGRGGGAAGGQRGFQAPRGGVPCEPGHVSAPTSPWCDTRLGRTTGASRRRISLSCLHPMCWFHRYWGPRTRGRG
jgi:hypothetical protein